MAMEKSLPCRSMVNETLGVACSFRFATTTSLAPTVPTLHTARLEVLPSYWMGYPLPVMLEGFLTEDRASQVDSTPLTHRESSISCMVWMSLLVIRRRTLLIQRASLCLFFNVNEYPP